MTYRNKGISFLKYKYNGQVSADRKVDETVSRLQRDFILVSDFVAPTSAYALSGFSENSFYATLGITGPRGGSGTPQAYSMGGLLYLKSGENYATGTLLSNCHNGNDASGFFASGGLKIHLEKQSTFLGSLTVEIARDGGAGIKTVRYPFVFALSQSMTGAFHTFFLSVDDNTQSINMFWDGAAAFTVSWDPGMTNTRPANKHPFCIGANYTGSAAVFRSTKSPRDPLVGGAYMVGVVASDTTAPASGTIAAWHSASIAALAPATYTGVQWVWTVNSQGISSGPPAATWTDSVSTLPTLRSGSNMGIINCSASF